MSGDGNSFLTEELTVTNPVGEAEDGQVYAQLTDLEDIIRDMLTVNLEPNPAVTGASLEESLEGSLWSTRITVTSLKSEIPWF